MMGESEGQPTFCYNIRTAITVCGEPRSPCRDPAAWSEQATPSPPGDHVTLERHGLLPNQQDIGLNHHRLKAVGLRSSAKADWGRHHGSTLKSASSSRSTSC